MTNRPDDQFTFQGRTWLRSWEDHAYHWTSGNLKVGWMEVETIDNGHDEDGEVLIKHVKMRYAMVDGKVIGLRYPTTKAAMLEATRASVREAA